MGSGRTARPSLRDVTPSAVCGGGRHDTGNHQRTVLARLRPAMSRRTPPACAAGWPAAGICTDDPRAVPQACRENHEPLTGQGTVTIAFG